MKSYRLFLMIMAVIILPTSALADKAVVWVPDKQSMSAYQHSVRESNESEELLTESTKDVGDILDQMINASDESAYISHALDLAEGYGETIGKIDSTLATLRDTKSKASSALNSGTYKENGVLELSEIMDLEATIPDINNHWGSFDSENKVFITAMNDLDKSLKSLKDAGISGANPNTEAALMKSIEVADFKIAFLSKLKRLYLVQSQQLEQRIEGGEQIHLSDSSILNVSRSASSVAKQFIDVDKMYRKDKSDDAQDIAKQTSRSPYQQQ